MNLNRPTPIEIATLIAAILAAFCICAAGIAKAAPVPQSEFTRDAHLTLARACAREADLYLPRDHALVANVTARFWRTQKQGWSFAETVRRHTMLDRDTTRSRWARSLPWGPLGVLSTARELRAWADLLSLLRRWSLGEVRDPCPNARTWSARPPTQRAVRNMRGAGLVPCDVCGTRNIPWCRRGDAV